MAALRVLAQVLADDESQLTPEFSRLNGEYVLLYVLSHTDTPEEQVFAILLKMAAGTHASGSSVGIKRPQLAVLVMYLLHVTSLPLKASQRVLRLIDDHFMTAGTAGRQVWMATSGLGLGVILNLFRTLDASLFPAVIALLQQTAPSWAALEIEQLVSLILGAHAQVSVSLRVELLDLLIQLLTQRAVGMDHMRGGNGFEYIMCLLDSDSEALRCAGMKLLGLMLCDDSKCQKAWSKVNGFEVLGYLLRQHPFTSLTPTTLLQLALGSFKMEGSPGGGGTTIVHAQVVQVVLELLPLSTDTHMTATQLNLLANFLDNKANANSLLAAGALDWCRIYLTHLTASTSNATSPDSSRSSSREALEAPQRGQKAAGSTGVVAMHAIVGRLFMCGLFGDVKALKVKELVDFEDFHIVVMKQVLDHIEKHSHIPALSATSVLKTLAQVCQDYY